MELYLSLILVLQAQYNKLYNNQQYQEVAGKYFYELGKKLFFTQSLFVTNTNTEHPKPLYAVVTDCTSLKYSRKFICAMSYAAR